MNDKESALVRASKFIPHPRYLPSSDPIPQNGSQFPSLQEELHTANPTGQLGVRLRFPSNSPYFCTKFANSSYFPQLLSLSFIFFSSDDIKHKPSRPLVAPLRRLEAPLPTHSFDLGSLWFVSLFNCASPPSIANRFDWQRTLRCRADMLEIG